MDFRHQSTTYNFPNQGQSTGTSTLAPHFVTSRPLSDIREITEPSLIEALRRKPVGEGTLKRRPSIADSQPSQIYDTKYSHPVRAPSRQSNWSPRKPLDGQDDHASTYSIPLDSVPLRSSSRTRHKRSTSIPRAPAVILPVPGNAYPCITNRGQSHSPVRDFASRIDPQESDRARRVPSKTIVKVENITSKDILIHPTHQHPRVRVDLQVAAPLFVGGSSVEGVVRIVVDEAERVRHKNTLTMERVAVDLLGIEEISGAKRNIFLSLGNELVDLVHPPPVDMVISQLPFALHERSWILTPSVSSLPFLITLPLEVGPPPFHSRFARIRYVLCATVTIKDAGRQLCVRSTQETAVLSVYDRE